MLLKTALTSVEHDRRWYNQVTRKLAETNHEVDYLLHEDGALHSWESEYVGVAKHMAIESLDFCLIDGTSRDHCALACLDKLKQGGILIIDNVNWYVPRERPSFAPNSRAMRDGYASDGWMKAAEILHDWRCVWTSDGVTDTAFWVHP
jgi:predicted O-methyltransferase YrrM